MAEMLTVFLGILLGGGLKKYKLILIYIFYKANNKTGNKILAMCLEIIEMMISFVTYIVPTKKNLVVVFSYVYTQTSLRFYLLLSPVFYSLTPHRH